MNGPCTSSTSTSSCRRSPRRSKTCCRVTIASDADPRPERLPRRRGCGARVDGELVAAAEEERFNRVKHCAGFPALAARWCLEDAGLDAGRPRPRRDRPRPAREPRREAPPQRSATGRALGYVTARLSNAAKVRDVERALAEALGVPTSALRARRSTTSSTTARTSRARSSSRRSRRRRCSRSTASATSPRRCSPHGRGNRLEVLDRVLFPHSLGIFYTAVTQWLGFPHYGDEGKVMGLAPYGDPARTCTAMREPRARSTAALRARARLLHAPQARAST